MAMAPLHRAFEATNEPSSPVRDGQEEQPEWVPLSRGDQSFDPDDHLFPECRSKETTIPIPARPSGGRHEPAVCLLRPGRNFRDRRD